LITARNILKLNETYYGVRMKLAFIYSFQQSSWKSCQTITKNLRATYKSLTPVSNQKDFDLNDQTSLYDILLTAQEIAAFTPDQIVILDHKPHPYKILDLLYKSYTAKKIKKLPQIIIHIFGDFTLYGAQWLKIEKTLKHFSVKFVCASDSQKELVGKFLKNKKTGLYKCPFPVDANEFYFDEKLRNKNRKELGFTDAQNLYIYTGRLSLQKKILDLILDFSLYLKMSKDDAYLFLAGDFDDLGNPFKGIYSREGLYFLSYAKLMESLSDDAKKRIRYVGNLSTEELQALYSSADHFVSMSAHNDEDYGMSPAEALSTGLPCVLSDWAGYQSFKFSSDNQCFLIKTSLENNKIGYDKAQFLKTLVNLNKSIEENRKNRVELQAINTKYLSVVNNKAVIKNIIEDKIAPFSGFTPLLKELALAFEASPPFATKVEYQYNDLYKKIYDSYLSK
jgi:glycosyltransferase involved in cell wall biosynthesis